MADMQKKTILLVEDDFLIAMTEKISLEKYGYRVIAASAGEEAVEAIEPNPGIDLILMDINLGEGIDGTEAAGRILQKHELPIIFVSNHTEPEIVEKTEKITSYGYVVKNSSITVLDASIKMAFKLFEAKKSAAHAAEQFRAIVENTSDCIMRYDRQGRHLYGNPSALAAAGLTIDAYMGRTHRDLGHPEALCVLCEDTIQDVFDTGLSRTIEFEADLAHGRAFLQVQYSPEFNARGSVNSVIGVARDISVLKRTQSDLLTHQAELQMQNEELRDAQADMDALRIRHFNLYDMATVAYFTLTGTGLIKEANLTACDMLRVNRSELEKRRLGEFIAAENETIYYQFHRSLVETGGLQHCSLRMRRHDGTTFAAFLKAQIARDETGEDVCRLAVVEREQDMPVEDRQGARQ